MADKQVTLNVGGTFFTTKFSTLTQYPNSKLAQMVVESETREENDGSSLFIDRDPTLFRLILNCLRLGRVLLPDKFKETEMLRQEALYYELYDLILELPVANQSEEVSDVQGTIPPQEAQPTPRRREFLYVQSHAKERDVAYHNWHFESSVSICQEIARAITGEQQPLGEPKYIQSAKSLKIKDTITSICFAKLMIDLGFEQHCFFEGQNMGKLRRVFMRLK